MNRSPLLATLLLASFLVGVPILVITRLTDGVLPSQAFDIPLVLGVLAWMFVSKAIIDRDTAIRSLVENRLSPRWQANNLVEQSLAGVGFIGRRKDQPETKIYRLTLPQTDIAALLPPAVPLSAAGRDCDELHEADLLRRSVPTLRATEPTAPPVLATEEYVVDRGDTFWSIAEARLGDGRHWKSIEEANLGREVAPGVVFAEGIGVRIGWTMLVPPMAAATAEGDEQ